MLFTLALTWMAVIAGLSAKTVDGASAFSYPLIFLPFISSAFVPTESMPAPVAWFAENQPVTAIVDTTAPCSPGSRWVPTSGWRSLGCVGILVVGYLAARSDLPPQDQLTTAPCDRQRRPPPHRGGRRRCRTGRRVT